LPNVGFISSSVFGFRNRYKTEDNKRGSGNPPQQVQV